MRKNHEDDEDHEHELTGGAPDDGRLDAGRADTEAEVVCPSCGEPVVLSLDPTGGEIQEYEEDCQVCCRPWRVHVTYDDEGTADVRVEEA